MSGHLSSMSTTAPSRIMLRHTRFIVRQTRRHASTTEAAKDTAAKTKETASNVTSKASGGLSRVTSSTGPAVSRAAQAASKAISNIGGRTGRMISFVQCESKLATRSQGHSANQLGHLEHCPRNNGSLYLWTMAQSFCLLGHRYLLSLLSSF